MAYTLEQLQSMGAKPVQAPSSKSGGYTLQELQGMGAKPVQNTKPPKSPVSLGEKFLNAGTRVSDFFGGKSIADTFGTEIAKIGKNKEEKQYLERTAPTPLQTAGSGLQLAAGLTPVGRLGESFALGAKALGAGKKLAKVAGNVGSFGTAGYALDVGANLQDEKPALTPGAGTAIGVGLPLMPPIVKGAAKLGFESLGVTTGTGAGVTKRMFDAARQGGDRAKEATDALRGKIGPENIVQDARDALGSIVQNRTHAYQTDLKKIAGNLKTYDVSPIRSAIKDNLKKFHIGVAEDGALDFSQSAIRFDKAAQQEVNTIFEEMKKFGTKPGDQTAVGIDSLKRAFGDLYSKSSNVRAFTTSVKAATRKVLSQVKGYDKLTKEYEDSTNLIKEIQRGLSLGDKAQTDTAFRKLTSALRVNNEFRQQLIKELDAVSGKDLSTQIAGQQMSEILPRGLMRQFGAAGAIGGAATGFAVPLLKAALFFSPRVVGEILTALGYTARKADQIMKKIAPQGLQSPGDLFLKTSTGRKTEDYLKNLQPGLSMKNVSQLPEKPLVFTGFKNLTTKLLEDLKGRSTVSKQYLLDATNRPELKQVERNLFRDLLKGEGDTISVKDFANKVKTELLPLKRKKPTQQSGRFGGGEEEMLRYEGVVLPDDLRGPIANYSEHIYESPIKTSAGDVHFQDGYGNTPEKYFAHSRVEDLPDTDKIRTFGSKSWPRVEGLRGEDISNVPSGTRRIIEIQSDLFQKGRLEGEADVKQIIPPRLSNPAYEKLLDEYHAIETSFTLPSQERLAKLSAIKRQTEDILNKYNAPRQAQRAEELSKLEPYRNTWLERIVREEVKQAAKDGKTKLQFPVGETALRIEGLGGEANPWRVPIGEASRHGILSEDLLRTGMQISRDHGERWVITDVLENGKFKAIPVDALQNFEDELAPLFGSSPDDAIAALAKGDTRVKEILAAAREQETFDISGKIDTQNPIYKFYEKDVQKYLTKKYGGKRIKDARGVEWIEIDVPKGAGRLPIEAFGLIPPILGKREED